MKKILALILALCMVFALAACGQDTAPVEDSKPAEEAAEELAEGHGVAMLTVYDNLNDQSFNQTTYEACKDYCEANGISFNYYKPQGNSVEDRIKVIKTAVEDGADVIVMPGSQFAGVIVAAAPVFPEVKFVALDVSEAALLEAAVVANGEAYDGNPENWELSKYIDMSNVYCMVYREELCGYMAGYTAVSLGYTELGFLGGIPLPSVMRYGYGYVQGADAAAAELGKDVSVKYAYGNQFTGSRDITEVMDTWYDSGIEVVFACGGGIFTSVAEAAMKADGKMIGVDVDQSFIIDGGYAEGMTVTSAMKDLAASTKTALTAIYEQNAWADLAGKIDTLGLISGDDPEANYVQIPMESTQWSDSFTKEDYADLVAAMFDGSVTVSDDTSAEPAVSAVSVEYLGILG